MLLLLLLCGIPLLRQDSTNDVLAVPYRVIQQLYIALADLNQYLLSFLS